MAVESEYFSRILPSDFVRSVEGARRPLKDEWSEFG